MAPLTHEQISEMRRLRRNGMWPKEIAKRIGCARSTVSRHTSGITSVLCTTLAPEKQREIHRLHRQGMNYKAIGAKVGVNAWTAKKYANGPINRDFSTQCYMPSPMEIQLACQDIRKNWSDDERRKRALWAEPVPVETRTTRRVESWRSCEKDRSSDFRDGLPDE